MHGDVTYPQAIHTFMQLFTNKIIGHMSIVRELNPEPHPFKAKLTS